MNPKVSICVLTYGEYPELARRCLDSIRAHYPRDAYQLIVGANAVCHETKAYLERLEADGFIDALVLNEENLNKNPMMRLMFEKVTTSLIWWFDDDSYVESPVAWSYWMGQAAKSDSTAVQWGQKAWCDEEAAFTELKSAVSFVRKAPWYQGLPPPSWRPGGGGEMDYNGQGTGDGRWFFIVGGCWLIRTQTVRKLDWPDRRLVKMGDDVYLGEAIRQQGWTMRNIGAGGIAINTQPRRGQSGWVEKLDFPNT